MDFKKLSQKELGEALGITPRSIQRWECPRNNDGTYSLPDVFQWRTGQAKKAGASMKEIDEKSKEALARWRDEKAKLAELERKQLEHQLIDIDQVRRLMFNHGQHTREMLESMPVRAAALVAPEFDQFSCQQILADEVYHSLITLCDWLRTHPEALEEDNQIEAQLDCVLLALKDRKLDPVEYIKNHIQTNSLVFIEEQTKNGKTD